MYLLENPVMQRELLVNLRMKRTFVLMLVYQALLAMVVYFAWPQQSRLVANAAEARGLVNMVFLGQYVLASLMAPSFAAGTITGEKERKTYEMLLASPLQPAAICWGKLVSSLAHLALLIVASAPIVMLCLPLGGVSIYEVLIAYLGLIMSVITFGMISVACSSCFQRTSASLVASYVLILPLALLAVFFWGRLEGQGEFRLWFTALMAPFLAAVISVPLFQNTAYRLLYPPDVGSEGKDVVDLEREAREAVGLVIRRDQFPDRLFAPPKRETWMEDGTNPIYEKEIHSEIFSQGTLMLRLVIQISMFLAIPIMAVDLFAFPYLAAWYVGYVLVFNMLVGPVFSAGSVTSERERQTLDLLLTTTITPWQILWGKLVAGLRVSSVLTLFLVWPLILAFALVSFYWVNWISMVACFAIILVTCLTTGLIALFCSVLFQKTTTSLITTYVTLLLIFMGPIALTVFAKSFANGPDGWGGAGIEWVSVVSPFAAAFSIPFTRDVGYADYQRVMDRLFPDNWMLVGAYLGITLLVDALLFGVMMRLFHARWRVAQ